MPDSAIPPVDLRRQPAVAYAKFGATGLPAARAPLSLPMLPASALEAFRG